MAVDAPPATVTDPVPPYSTWKSVGLKLGFSTIPPWKFTMVVAPAPPILKTTGPCSMMSLPPPPTTMLLMLYVPDRSRRILPELRVTLPRAMVPPAGLNVRSPGAPVHAGAVNPRSLHEPDRLTLLVGGIGLGGSGGGKVIAWGSWIRPS